MNRKLRGTPIARTRRRRESEAMRKRVDKIYRPKQKPQTAGVLSNSLVQVAGTMYDAVGAGVKGTQIPVVNFGRPADAIYRPATPEGAVVAAGVQAAGSGGGGRPLSPADPGTVLIYHNQLLGLAEGDPHPQYLTTGRGDQRYYTQAQINSLIGGQGSQQDILDHLTTQPAGYVVGTTEDQALGWFSLTNNGDENRGQILTTDDEGRLIVTILQTTDHVDTPYVYNPRGNLLLEGYPDVLWRGSMASEGAISGQAGITLDGEAGHIDTQSILAQEARFEAFIAEVKRAEAGRIVITNSLAETSEPWIVPASGQTTDITVFEFDGLPGFDPFEDGDDTEVAFYSTGDIGAPYIAASSSVYGSGTTGSGATIEDQDYDSLDAGRVVPNWRDTGANNVMTEYDTLFNVEAGDGGNNHLNTTYTENNFHTHYDGTGYQALTNYRFSGKFSINSNAAGIGITLFSGFGAGGTDEYYRIRRYSGSTSMHVSNHGSAGISGGTTTTTYDPSDYAGEYTQFTAEVSDTGSRTEIKAKFWREGDAEPAAWDIDFWDSTAGRLTSGTFGFWAMAGGTGINIDDLLVVTMDNSNGQNTVLSFARPPGTVDGDYMIAVLVSEDGNPSQPTGWDWVAGENINTSFTKMYRRQAQSSDPSFWQTTSTTDFEVFAQIYSIRDASGYLDTNTSVAVNGGDGEIDIPQMTHGSDGGLSIAVAVRTEGGTDTYTGPPGWALQGKQASPGHAAATYTREYGSSETSETAHVTSDPPTNSVLLHSTFEGYATDATSFGQARGKVVKKVPQPEGLKSNETVYEWTTTDRSSAYGTGVTIQPGAIILDYGVPGDSYIEITTLDQAGHPYIDFVIRGEFPDVVIPGDTLKARQGVLDGIAGQSGVGAIYYGDNGEIAKFATSGMELVDVDSQWKSGTDVFIEINTTEGIEIQESANTTPDEARGYTFVTSFGNDAGGMYGYNGNAYRAVLLESRGLNDRDARVYINAESDGVDSVSYVTITAKGTDVPAADEPIIYLRSQEGDGYIHIAAPEVRVYAELQALERFYAREITAITNTTTAIVIKDAGDQSMAVFDAVNYRYRWFGEQSILFRSESETGDYINLRFEDGGTKYIFLSTAAMGAGSVGPSVYVGRNSEAGYNAAGHYRMSNKNGNSYSIWTDASGLLRIVLGQPGYSTDTTGTIVGTQTSSRETKEILGQGPTPEAALDVLLAAPVYRFKYKRQSSENSDEFCGIITDEVPELGWDNGKAFDPVSANGYTIQAIKALAARIEEIEKKLGKH